MKLQKRHRKVNLVVNIAPLIDVILLLIIFFMTVMQMTPFDLEPLTLPQARQAATPSHFSDNMVVNVKKDGQILIFGIKHTTSTFRTILLNKLQTRTPQQLTILIRGDRQTPWKIIKDILIQCAQSGVTNVKLAITPTPSESVIL